MIHVLLAEDDEGDALLLEDAMENARFENIVHHCKDGIEVQEFLQNAENPRPDFILLDLNMPRMSGHEVLKWIKMHEEHKDIPVGILTTSSSTDDVNQSYKNYASYYITKPATFDELKNVVALIDEFWMKTVKLPGKGHG